jgi:type III secretion protein L
MNFYQIENSKIVPAGGTKVIKRDELKAFFAAEEIISKSEELAAEIREKAEISYKQRYDEGFEKGQNDGKMEYSDKILELIMSQVDTLAELENDMAGVVVDSVKKIIGELPSNEQITRVVRKAINTVRGMKRLIVRVSADDEPAVREDLQMLLVSPDGSSGYIELVADATLHHGDCIMETSMGIVNASLDFQIDMLKQSINNRIQQKNME